MAHNTHRESQDAATGLRKSAEREVAAARPTVAIKVYSPSEKAAAMAEAQSAFDTAHAKIAKFKAFAELADDPDVAAAMAKSTCDSWRVIANAAAVMIKFL